MDGWVCGGVMVVLCGCRPGRSMGTGFSCPPLVPIPLRSINPSPIPRRRWQEEVFIDPSARDDLPEVNLLPRLYVYACTLSLSIKPNHNESSTQKINHHRNASGASRQVFDDFELEGSALSEEWRRSVQNSENLKKCVLFVSLSVSLSACVCV